MTDQLSMSMTELIRIENNKQDQTNVTFDTINTERVYALSVGGFDHLLNTTGTFTRSDGTMISRIYERLTKSSRRRVSAHAVWLDDAEANYRRGVKDTLTALRTELS